SAAEKDLWGPAKWHEASILSRVIDCPKPELLEYTCIPEKKARDCKGSNYANSEHRYSHKHRLKRNSSLCILPQHADCSEWNKENRRLLHQRANPKQQPAGE